jgi:hypothetical protein
MNGDKIQRARVSLTTICVLTFMSAASAARVTGQLDRWALWSFDTDTIQADCIAGESPCDETQVPPSNFSGPATQITIPVEGNVRFLEGIVLNLTLIQSRQVTLPIADGSHGALSLSGLRWILSNGLLIQQPGAFAQCSTSSPVCRVIAASIQSSEVDSPLNFDGIPANFPIQFGALLLNRRPAFQAIAGKDGHLSIDAASSQSQSLPTSKIFNAASVAHFRLTDYEEEP